MKIEISLEKLDTFGGAINNLLGIVRHRVSFRPFTLVSTHPMTKEGWMDGFYQDLKPRSLSLLDHQNEKVQRIAKDNLKEIELFEKGGITSFNYVFYVLRKK